MSDNNSEPKIVQLGAGEDDSTRGVNLDVSGTTGPDYLGQETVDVDGHPMDRPGVQSRLPESVTPDPDGHTHPDISRMDTGQELPVLLSSDMRADPCEGVQGSYTKIVEGECVRCGYDRLRVSVHTLSGEHQETCNACGARQNRSADDGYTMPTTDRERAEAEREAGEKIATLSNKEAYDMESKTGMGPYISIVDDRQITRLHKDDIQKLLRAAVTR